MARAITVIIVAETPEHDATQNPDQPPSTIRGYRVQGEEGENVAAVMERVLAAGDAGGIGPFGVGTTFFAFDEARAERRVLRSQLASE